jgi:hypothetical protein
MRAIDTHIEAQSASINRQSKQLQEQAQIIRDLEKELGETEGGMEYWIREHGSMKSMYNDARASANKWRSEFEGCKAERDQWRAESMRKEDGRV